MKRKRFGRIRWAVSAICCGATAHHPAMLFYLDNWQNTAPDAPGKHGKFDGINENYAREVMELHTLGVNGGYSQQDVIALAHILTGWSIDRSAARRRRRMIEPAARSRRAAEFPARDFQPFPRGLFGLSASGGWRRGQIRTQAPDANGRRSGWLHVLRPPPRLRLTRLSSAQSIEGRRDRRR